MKRQSRPRKIVRLRALRREREMTQVALAKRVGISPLTILRFERGYQQPKLDEALKIAGFFGLPVEEVFRLIEVPA